MLTRDLNVEGRWQNNTYYIGAFYITKGDTCYYAYDFYHYEWKLRFGKIRETQAQLVTTKDLKLAFIVYPENFKEGLIELCSGNLPQTNSTVTLKIKKTTLNDLKK